MIAELIDKQDSFEVIRDRIASILFLEFESQKSLAVNAGLSPDDWDVRVFLERANPWDELSSEGELAKPIAHVWFEQSMTDSSATNTHTKQAVEGIFNIDCYALGISSNNQAGGQNPGDKEAALILHKTVRLVRNILMASAYANLGRDLLPKFVLARNIESIKTFRPPTESQTTENISVARIALKVKFSEYSPGAQPEILESVYAGVSRTDSGELVAESEIKFTP